MLDQWSMPINTDQYRSTKDQNSLIDPKCGSIDQHWCQCHKLDLALICIDHWSNMSCYLLTYIRGKDLKISQQNFQPYTFNTPTILQNTPISRWRLLRPYIVPTLISQLQLWGVSYQVDITQEVSWLFYTQCLLVHIFVFLHSLHVKSSRACSNEVPI